MYLWLLVISVYIPSSLSCDCVKFSGYKTLQEQFCEADFVIGIGVLDHDDAGTGGDRVYNVLLEDVYKGNPVGVIRKFMIQKTVKLYTYANEDKCGIILHPKEQYVVGGKIEGGKNWISICHLNYPGFGMPCARKLFQDGCNSCTIKRCGPGFCSSKSNQCKYRADMSNKRYDDACVPGPSGCTWQECDEMTVFSTAIVPAFNGAPFNPRPTTPHFDPFDNIPEENVFPGHFQPPSPPSRFELPPIIDNPESQFGNPAVLPTFKPPRRKPTTPKWINFWLLPEHFQHAKK